MRSRHAAELNKTNLLALCGHWGYASDVWRPRGNRPTRTRPPHPPPQPERALLPPALPCSNDAAGSSALWAHVAETMRPLSASSCAAMRGNVARALATRDAVAAASFGREVPALAFVEADIGSWMRNVGAMLLSVRAVDDEPCFAAASPSPSSALLLPPCSRSAALEAPATLLCRGAAFYSDAAARCGAAAGARGAPAADVTWLTEAGASFGASSAMCTAAGALLSRAAAAGADAHARAAVLVLEALAAHLAELMAAVAQRRAWVEALGGGAESTLPPPRLMPLVCARRMELLTGGT